MRDDILKYLNTVMESTAKTISERIGMPRREVAMELNAMESQGIVERRMKGGEYAYWLTRAEAKPAEKVANSVETAPATLPVNAAAVPKVVPAEPAKPEVERAPKHDPDALDLILKLEDLRTERDALLAEIVRLQDANAKLRENTTALERSIDDLTGVADVELPKIYVTVGKYVKPKRHADLPRAQRRAATLVRTEKESEVLVCAPVGRMVRGSEWKSQ